MSNPRQLADCLQDLSEPEYVRFVADWIGRATREEIEERPPLTGDEVIDALVAAAAAYVGIRRYDGEPGWTVEPGRVLHRLWHPGIPGMFAWSLVHSPASFKSRGILIEEDSLVSI